MPMPHSQGAFRTLLVAEERQCEVIGDTVSLAEAACAEPLAVALHAVAQYGDLSGRRAPPETGSGEPVERSLAPCRASGAWKMSMTAKPPLAACVTTRHVPRLL